MPETLTQNKRIARNTLLLYIRMFFVMAVSLLTVRILLQKLGIQDYGIYNAVAGFVSTLTFVSSVLSVASQRFFSFYLGKKDIATLNNVFSIIIICYFIVAFIILLLGESMGLWFVTNKMNYPIERYQAVLWVFQFAILSCIFSFLCSPLQAIIIAYEEMNVYAYVGIMEVLLKLGIIFLLSALPVDKLILYAILHFLVFVIILLIYLVIVSKKHKEIKFSFHWDKKEFSDIISYSSWSIFGSLTGLSNTQGTNIMLNVFFGPIANAAYSIAAQVSTAISLFTNSFYNAVRPAMIKSYAQNQSDYLYELFYFSSKILFILSFLLLLPTFCETKAILCLWLGDINEEMIIFTRLSIIYSFLLIISNPITTIVQAANKVKQYHLIVDTFTLLSLPVSYLLFSLQYPSYTAYIVTIVVFSIAHYLRLTVLKKIIDFSFIYYFKSFVFPIFLTVVICYIISKLIKLNIEEMTSPLLSLICNCTFDCIVVLFVSGIVVFSKTERKKIISLILHSVQRKI